MFQPPSRAHTHSPPTSAAPKVVELSPFRLAANALTPHAYRYLVRARHNPMLISGAIPVMVLVALTGGTGGEQVVPWCTNSSITIIGSVSSAFSFSIPPSCGSFFLFTFQRIVNSLAFITFHPTFIIVVLFI